MGADTSPQRHAPATARNRQAILDVLQRVLPESGTVLEVASGTGEHAAFLGPRLAPRLWQPSDPAPDLRASIAAWSEGLAAVLPPLDLDAREPLWPVERTARRPLITAVVCINMIHIAPWDACTGLLAGAGRLLPAGGILYLYGPYKRDGRHTAPSNEAFDKSLRARDRSWGVRDLVDVARAAAAAGFNHAETIDMPANNLSVVFARA